MGTVPEGTAEDVDRAVAAARAAFPAWSALPVEERTALLTKVAEALGARMDPLADLITHEVGMPHDAVPAGPGGPARSTRSPRPPRSPPTSPGSRRWATR